MNMEMPLCFGTSQARAAGHIAKSAESAPVLHVFCPFRMVHVTIAVGAGNETREVGTAGWLREQLQPDLVTPQHPREVMLLLLGRPVLEQRLAEDVENTAKTCVGTL